MQISEEKAPERKFVDRARQHAAWPPPIEGRQARAGADDMAGARQGADKGLQARNLALELGLRLVGQAPQHLPQRVEVADDGDKKAAQQPGADAAPPKWPARAMGLRGWRRQVVNQGKGAGCGRRKQRGHGQVEGNRGRDACELDEHADQEIAVVVVVDITTGVVRIERRHPGAARGGVEECELHELLAALPGLPEVRIEQANRHKKQERAAKHQLRDHEQTAVRTHKGGHLATIAPPESQREQADQRKGNANGQQVVANDRHMQAGDDPNQPAGQQPAEQAGHQVAAVTQMTKNAEGQRPGEELNQHQRQPPDDDGDRR